MANRGFAHQDAVMAPDAELICQMCPPAPASLARACFTGGVNLVYSLMGQVKHFPTLNQLIEYYVGHPAEFLHVIEKNRKFGLKAAAPKGPSMSEMMTTMRDKWKLIKFVVVPGGDPKLIEKGRRDIRALRRSVTEQTGFQDALQADAMAQAVSAFVGK